MRCILIWYRIKVKKDFWRKVFSVIFPHHLVSLPGSNQCYWFPVYLPENIFFKNLKVASSNYRESRKKNQSSNLMAPFVCFNIFSFSPYTCFYGYNHGVYNFFSLLKTFKKNMSF